MGLRDLDQRLLPAAQQRTRRAADGVLAARHRAGDLYDDLRGPVGWWPGLLERLRRLDATLGERGPFRAFSALPAFSALGIALLFLTGSAFALQQHDAGAPSSQVDQGPTGDPFTRGSAPGLSATLGPQPGQSVAGYLADSRAQVVALSRSEQAGTYTALVSLSAYGDSAGVPRLLTGVTFRRAYLLALGAKGGGQLLSVDLTGVPGTGVSVALRSGYRAATANRRRFVTESEGYVRTTTPDSTETTAERNSFVADARRGRREAAAYQAGCACVAAVVVTAKARDLADLLALRGVRGVQPVPPGTAVTDQGVSVLLPDVSGVLSAALTPLSVTS